MYPFWIPLDSQNPEKQQRSASLPPSLPPLLSLPSHRGIDFWSKAITFPNSSKNSKNCVCFLLHFVVCLFCVLLLVFFRASYCVFLSFPLSAAPPDDGIMRSVFCCLRSDFLFFYCPSCFVVFFHLFRLKTNASNEKFSLTHSLPFSLTSIGDVGRCRPRLGIRCSSHRRCCRKKTSCKMFFSDRKAVKTHWLLTSTPDDCHGCDMAHASRSATSTPQA